MLAWRDAVIASIFISGLWVGEWASCSERPVVQGLPCERGRSLKVGCREPVTPFRRYRRALLRRQHRHVPRCGAWRVTEPVAKLACEMGVVAKTTGVRDATTTCRAPPTCTARRAVIIATAARHKLP